MAKILFVCHGNICRSPMAEFIMKDLVKKAGLSSRFQISSAAVSAEEVGNSVYPPARRELLRHGIDPGGKRAVRIRAEDYDRYDRILYMDKQNARWLRQLFSGDPAHKLRRLLDCTDHPGDIDDPWYTGDFETAYLQILSGCQGLLAELEFGEAQKNEA